MAANKKSTIHFSFLSTYLRSILILSATIGGILIYSGYHIFFSPNILVDQKPRCVKVASKVTYGEFHEHLVNEGILKNARSFKWIARFLRYDRLMKPGSYCLRSNMSNWAAVRLLRSGAQKPVGIVLHDIRSKKMLSERITANLDLPAEKFLALLEDEAFLKKFGFNKENILTMFIPNTYEVYWTIKPKKLFKKMHKEYKKFWNSERLQKAKKIKLSPIEVGILASIVRDETILKKELPIIAGVYLRRLRNRIPLQACPTLKHIAGGGVPITRVLHEYKKIDSPYNTYKYRGLPPGPINVPSVASIDAVLNYTKHQYLYFCSKGGLLAGHHFSRNYKEHLRYAGKYHRALNKARVYR